MDLIGWSAPALAFLDDRPLINPRQAPGSLPPPWWGWGWGWGLGSVLWRRIARRREPDRADADVCDDLLSPRGQGVVAAAAGGGGVLRRGGGRPSAEFSVQRMAESALAAMRRASFRGSAVNVAGASGPRVRVEQERRLPIESLHLLSRHASGRV